MQDMEEEFNQATEILKKIKLKSGKHKAHYCKTNLNRKLANIQGRVKNTTSGIADTVEELDQLVKDNEKSLRKHEKLLRHHQDQTYRSWV
jgi:septation ring formation regulator EzrA